MTSNFPPSTNSARPTISHYFLKETNLINQDNTDIDSKPIENNQNKINLNDSIDDFMPPLVLKKSKNTKFKLSKSRRPQHDKRKNLTGKKIKSPKNYTIEIIKDSLNCDGQNIDHLQMAVALSKSTYEAEYGQPSKPTMKKDETGEETHDISRILQNSKPTNLERFGFKHCKPSFSVTNRKKIFTEVKAKNKIRYKYITPVLNIRSSKDRESLISSKISFILSQLNLRPTVAQNPTIISSKLLEFIPKNRRIFQLAEIYEVGNFYIDSLDLPKSEYKCGCMLKDWSLIPGRDKSPERHLTENTSSGIGTLETIKSRQSNRVDKQSVFPKFCHSDTKDSLSMLETQEFSSNGSLGRATSPDLFTSEDDEFTESQIKMTGHKDFFPEADVQNEDYFTKSYSELCDRPDSECTGEMVVSHDGIKEISVVTSNEVAEITDYDNEDNECMNLGTDEPDRDDFEKINYSADTTQMVIGKLEYISDNEDMKVASFPTHRGVLNCERSEIHISPQKPLYDSSDTINEKHYKEDGNERLSLACENLSNPARMEIENTDDTKTCQFSNKISSFVIDDTTHIFNDGDGRSMNFSLGKVNNDDAICIEISDDSNMDDEIEHIFEGKGSEAQHASDDHEILSHFKDEDAGKENNRTGLKRKKSYLENSGFFCNIGEENDVDQPPDYGNIDTPVYKKNTSFCRSSRGYNSLDLNVTDYVNSMLNNENYSFNNPCLESNSSSSFGSESLNRIGLNYSSKFITTKTTRAAIESSSNIIDLTADDQVNKEVLVQSGETVPSKRSITPTNYIIKTRNVTPMPDYDNLTNIQLQRRLRNFGIKDLKRTKGIKLLKYIYESTHPPVDAVDVCGEYLEEERKVVKRRKKTSTLGNNLDTDTSVLACEEESNLIDIVGDSLLENERLDDLIFERTRSVRIQSCQVPLQIVWHNFLCCNPAIREQILLYQPLILSNIDEMLKTLGFKFKIEDLLTFLDRKCICARFRNNGASQRRNDACL